MPLSEPLNYDTVSSAESKLERLLAEAAAAHETVERLISSRPEPPLVDAVRSPPESLHPSSGLQQRLERLTHLRESLVGPREIIEAHPPPPNNQPRFVEAPPPPRTFQSASPLLDVTEAMAADVRQSLLAPSLTAARTQTSPTHDDVADDVQASARLARVARTRENRLAREKTEARSMIHELEEENAGLRTALKHAQDAAEGSIVLRAELRASQAREHALEAQLDARTRKIEALQQELREAEAERERLRTLVTAQAWFQAQM